MPRTKRTTTFSLPAEMAERADEVIISRDNRGVNFCGRRCSGTLRSVR